jgi:sugar porter (SP) family MFS transporter
MNREMMIAGRFFAGMAIGMLSMLAPLYQSEIAHPSIRGRLTTLQQFFLGIGAFIASFVVYGMQVHHAGTAAQWRFPLGLQMAPCVPLATMIFLFPESPRWLMSVGKEEESVAALARLHANGDTKDNLVLAEAAELKAALAHEREVETGWASLFTNRKNFRRILMGITLQFSVQMTGVSVFQYYAPAVFANLGFGAERSLLFQSISSVVALIAQFSCILLVDRLGRRQPLIWANIAIGVTFIIGTALQARYPASTGNIGAAYAYIVMTWLFNFAFSCAVGPISWAYPAEIFSTSIRAKGTAVTSMACWVANFMIAQVSPIALDNIGWRYYLVFVVCSFTNALTFYLFFPETAGRTLEEMEQYINESGYLVPLHKSRGLRSATEREEELRRGITAVTGADEVLQQVQQVPSAGDSDKYSNNDEKLAQKV